MHNWGGAGQGGYANNIGPRLQNSAEVLNKGRPDLFM